MAIQENEASFKTTSHTLACSLYPYIKLEGFAEEGVQWEKTEKTNFRMGADGMTVKNSKPVLYTCTMTFLPNASCRTILDSMYWASTPQYGKTLVNNSIVYTEKNEMTGWTTIYSGGDIVSMDAGDSANLNDGQNNKSYTFTFTNKVMLPVK
ncbi:MAG: hypothetical protein J6T74_09315 [Clostridia bacterium]|nr:hypothetical protein [Clostridia bacterium]